MTTEERVLKQILENGGEAPLQIIVKKLGMGSTYIGYLCKILAKKGLVKNLKSKDWYKITRKGWNELKRLEKSIRGYPLKKHISRKKKTRITKRSRRSRKPKKKITKKPKRKLGRKVNKKIPKQTKTKRKSPKTKAKKKIIKKSRAKIRRLKTSAKKKKTKTSARLGVRKKKKVRIYSSIAKPRTPALFVAYQENKITERAPIIREELKTEEPKIEERVEEEIKPKEITSPEKKFKKLIKGFKSLFHSKK